MILSKMNQKKHLLCVLLEAYAAVITENGETSLVFQNKFGKHNVIHPILDKWCHDNMNNPLSVIHECPFIDLFYK